MEYKINKYSLQEEYYFNDEGQVYFYMPQSVNKGFLSFKQQVREVRSNQPGRSTHYLVVALYYVDGKADWIDIADTMARTAFKIPLNARGYVRHKNHDYNDLTLKNLEFIVQHPEHERPYEIHDLKGKIPYNMFKEGASSIEKPSMTTLPDKPSAPPAQKAQTDSVKLDLGDRDRSVVAELLYTLITEKEMSAADALKTLAIPGGYDTLELFLEGKDIVEERVVEEMARQRDQERDKEYVGTGKLYEGKPMFLGASTGRSYIKENDEYKLL